MIEIAESSGRETSISAADTTGASFTGVMSSRKVDEADRPPGSVAVTVIATLPSKFNGGKPENSRLTALKLNQFGSAFPSAAVTDNVSDDPLSGSLKLFAGNTKLTPASSGDV